MPSIIKSIESLAPGMIVDREVEVRGMVLLKAGTALTDTHIAQLKKWHVLNVSIASDSAPGAADCRRHGVKRGAHAPAGAGRLRPSGRPASHRAHRTAFLDPRRRQRCKYSRRPCCATWGAAHDLARGTPATGPKSLTRGKELATLWGVVQRVRELTADQRASVKELVKVISADPVLTSKVLRLVNSAAYGFSGNREH
jgi:hypothetical protein